MQEHTKKRPTRRHCRTCSCNTKRSNWRSQFEDVIDEYGEAGATLRGSRLREGLTQKELAKKVGINQANLSKMERGLRPIGKEMAKRLAKVLRTNYRLFL